MSDDLIESPESHSEPEPAPVEPAPAETAPTRKVDPALRRMLDRMAALRASR